MATFDLGRVTPIYKGDYSASASYELNDVVLYNGNLYWHVKATATVGILPTDTTVWKLAFADGGVRTEIRGYADDAQASAEAASASATSASTSATSAQSSATSASQSATQASTSATNASASASQAQEYAEQAEESAAALSDINERLAQKADTFSLSLCDVETVPASANRWNPDAVTSGGILANGNFYADESKCHEKIAVTPGETLYFYNLNQPKPSVQARWICAYDASNNVVSASGSNTAVSFFTVPDGIAYLTISTMLSYNAGFMVLSGQSEAPSAYIPYAEAYDRYLASYQFLKNIDLGAVVVDVPVYGIVETAITKTAGARQNTGTILTGGRFDAYQYSQVIPVSEGDVVKPVGNTNAYFRFVCAYSGSTVVPAAGNSSGKTEYIVPNGIDGICVTVPIEYAVTAVSIKQQTGTEERKYPIAQKLGKVNWKGNLSDGDSVELLPSNVRFNVVWVFTGHVSTMGKITIGVKTPSGEVKEVCSVDSTYLYYRLSSGSIASVAHGLEISEDLHIAIDSPFKVNELGGITICSKGNEYTLTETPYGTEMNNTPYLVSNGAVMTDCAFSWIPKDIDKPIWIFGDSWVSMYDTRWPFYMVQGGFTNSWMLNGFAGEGTDEAYESLLNLLTIRKPDYIVWLLGMNNRDSNTAVNDVWKSIYDKLTALCTEYKINLILYTVPNTPTINNNFKNDIVRTSGYRYIDGVAAVGDDGAGNWFTGYEQSNTDHNHTSVRGAKALFHRILTDFPEIAGNSL